ncbi:MULTISPECIES: fimbrial protein [Pseudomonas fluorescens group]|uniref:PapK protein n=1 Tax=Pseudomonas fluorescens TaxID=294 RepID=A0A0D0TP54_PSEFL|nr:MULTISPECIES: fimbrial protein [Pseudomonas fluorescens group]AZE62708.1 Minor fimbrial subunit StfG [Pseudomonas synxantha]KIR23629.1 Fimbrial adapter PapK precursor [Pseudomonas fluorescens]
MQFNINRTWLCTGLPALLTMLVVPNGYAVDNLQFRGTLVQGACSIRPGDEQVELKLRGVTSKFLYRYTRSEGKPFSLHLENCDTNIGDSVTITFSGFENPELPGLLAVDAGSGASGIGVGIETLQGRPLPLEVVSDEQALAMGDNVIELQAYVKGEPQAIQNQSIVAGGFSASSTFTLDYP